MRTAQKWFPITAQCQGTNFASVLAWKQSYLQPTKMQWRVVVFLAVLMAAYDSGPIAGPSDLSRALGAVLEQETTTGE